MILQSRVGYNEEIHLIVSANGQSDALRGSARVAITHRELKKSNRKRRVRRCTMATPHAAV
jgi:hypothetical protein